MDQPRRFNWRSAAFVLISALVVEVVLLAGYTLFSPVIPSFEPATAEVRRSSGREDGLWEWETNAVSPNGRLTVTGSTVIEVQETDTGAVVATLVPSPPGYLEGAAWADDETIILDIADSGVYRWRWRDRRLMSPRQALLGLMLILPVLGLIGAYWRGRRSV